jgi:flavodoxin
MRIAVIYDSQFGNTEQIAQSIAEALLDHADVRLLKVGQSTTIDLSGIDVFFIGGPTQGHGLSPALKSYVETLPHSLLLGKEVATFDTRYGMLPVLSGSAARSLAAIVRNRGGHLCARPESFFVSEKEGPLTDGETARAALWAQRVLRITEREAL